jgi:hypothetical protein
MYVEDRELSCLALDNACTAWDNLLDHHEKQGPITQVRLIQEVLSILSSKDVSVWSATIDHIFAQAVPTQDVLFMVVMLGTLEQEVDHIYSEMTSYYISNKMVTSRALSEQVEQEIVYKTQCKNSSETALPAQTGNCRDISSNDLGGKV